MVKMLVRLSTARTSLREEPFIQAGSSIAMNWECVKMVDLPGRKAQEPSRHHWKCRDGIAHLSLVNIAFPTSQKPFNFLIGSNGKDPSSKISSVSWRPASPRKKSNSQASQNPASQLDPSLRIQYPEIAIAMVGSFQHWELRACLRPCQWRRGKNSPKWSKDQAPRQPMSRESHRQVGQEHRCSSNSAKPL